MKKEIIISSLALFLIVTPAFAKQENPKENSPKNNQNHKKDTESLVQTITVSINPTVGPSVSPSPTIFNTHKPSKDEKEEECNPEEKYKNHGEYVSCIAREHRGGEEVSDAARSDIGKKHENDNDGNDDHLSPTISPVTSPVSSALGTIHGGFNPFKSFEDNLRRFFSFFLHFK